MNDTLITINNKCDVLNLDANSIHILNWKNINVTQKRFRVLLKDNENILFDTNEVDSSNPFCEFFFPFIYERKKITIYLEITDDQKNKMKYEKNFYTMSSNFFEASWITRLDNPIEKEWKIYFDRPNMIFEKEFDYAQPTKEVFLDICGLGYYTVMINNRRIDETFLNNDISNYGKTVYYDTFRIEDYLLQGKNVISIELANGWYNPAPIKLLGKYNVRSRMVVGKPCLISQISYQDDKNNLITINSDETWQSKNGNYYFDNLFIGERLIANYDQDGYIGQTVKIPGPGGKLTPSHIDKIKRTKKFSPKKIKQTDRGILIDFERMISGHFACDFLNENKNKIEIFYGEALKNDGEIDFQSSTCGTFGYNLQDLDIKESDPVIQKDEIMKSSGRFLFENKYTCHSFRYVLVKYENIKIEELANICAYTVHTDLKQSSTFECSDERINLLWQAAKDTKLNNIHSVFEDCPRERLGYGGDIVALIDSQICSFDVEQLLIKIIMDFTNDQTSRGGIPQTAPFMGIHTNGTSDRAGSLGWQLVLPVMLNKITNYFFQPGLFSQFEDNLKLHASYLLEFDYDYIRHCCLGDWGSMDANTTIHPPTSPDREFCSAIMYYLIIKEYYKIFNLADDEIVSKLFNKLTELEEKIVKEFYNEEGSFQGASQSSYSFALYANILKDNRKDKLLSNFITKIKDDKGILRTGIFGMPWTYKILGENNYDDIIYSWLMRSEAPSFLNMLSSNNQVIREYFDESKGSYNHAMFTSYSTWFIEKMLGIQFDDNTKKTSKLRISPYFPKNINNAKGSFDTIHGKISVDWKKENDSIKMIIHIPKSIIFVFDDKSPYYTIQSRNTKNIGFYNEFMTMLLLKK